MSHHSLGAAPQSQPSPSNLPSNPELAKRIERFHKAAQDLLAMYEPSEQRRKKIPHPHKTAKLGATISHRERCSMSANY